MREFSDELGRMVPFARVWLSGFGLTKLPSASYVTCGATRERS